jgi:hypothetical protein
MSEVHSEKRSFWEWIGKLSLILGLIWVTIQILKAYFEPKDHLEADVYVSEFDYPPKISAFGDNLSRENLSKLLTNSQLAERVPAIKENADEISSVFSELSTRFIFEFGRVGFAPFDQTMLKVSVSNFGETTLEGVRLEIPDIFASRYERSGRKSISEEGQIIDIGEMRSGEKVVVTAWQSGRPPWLHDQRIALTHKRGIGRVNLMAPIRADSWSYKFYKMPALEIVVLFLAFAFFLGCLVFLALAAVQRRRVELRPADAASTQS